MTTHGTMFATALAAAAGLVFSASAAYTVQTGETLQITDETVENYAGGIAFADATGTVEFNTSAAPTMNITGDGTVKKTSASAWTMTKTIPDFTGAYDLTAGVTSFSTEKVFGADASPSQILHVRDGATLSFAINATSKLNYRTIHAAGRGVADRGALEFVDSTADTSYGQFRNLVLEDDILIVFPNGGLVFIGDSNGIDLNGHDLHLAGKGNLTYLNKLKGNGEIVFEGASGKVPTWGVRLGTFDAGAKQAFRMSGNSKIYVIERSTRKPNVPIYVTGTGNTLAYSEYWNSAFEWNTNGVGWAGAITFTNAPGTAAKLTVASEGDNAYYKQFTLAGPITGPGQLAVDINHRSRICFAATNNTFSGGLYLGSYYARSGNVCALHPGSLPRYSSITCEYGRVDATFLPDAEDAWTVDDFARFVSQTTWKQNAFALMDVQAYTNGVLPHAPFTSNVIVRVGIGANGAIDLTGTTEQGFPAIFDWKYGHAHFTGPQKFEVDTFHVENGKLESAISDGTTVTNSAVVTLDGGVEVVTGTNMVRVGCGTADTARDATARLVVKNAFLHTSSTNTIWTAGRDEALVVGSGGNTWDRMAGILEVQDGAVVSNKLHVSGGGVGAGTGGGRGLVIQKGGTVYALGAVKDPHFGSAVGMAAHGAYDMRGGAFTAFGNFMVGAYAAGVWRQSGGDVVWTNYPGSTAKIFGIGQSNGGWGVVDMTGGRFRIVNCNLQLASGYNLAAQRAMLSIRGAGTYFGGPGTFWYAGANSNCNTSSVVVANGAVMQMASAINTTSKDSVLTFAYDGGTVRTGGDGFCLFGAENSWNPVCLNFKPANAPTAVLVYAGGMTLDTAGFTGGYSSVPFTAPTGGGVTGTTFAGELTGGTFSTIPQVVIVGDGHGASAVAEYDAERGAVTGISITCPGEGYTCARADVCYYRGNENGGTNIWYDCTIGANAQTGGFTKTGAGDFTLKATNTWGGALAVAGGTLKLGCEKAVPDNRPLTLSGGGVLDLNGNALTIASVTYGPGGGSIANASAATIPETFGIALSVDDMLAGRAVAFSGDVDLSKATITLAGDVPDDLDPEVCRRYDLVTATGTFSGKATVVSGTLPKGWRFVVRAKTVSCAYSDGLSLIIR